MNIYSHSRISCYEQCPLKFRYQYIDRIRPETGETIETFLGSRVHETLEKLYTDLKFEKYPELQELLHYYNKRWDEEYNDGILIVREEYTPENYRKMGERYITDYYNTYKPFNHSRTIALETEYTVPIDDEENYKMHVRIDRLAINDGVYEIHDYKTSNNLPGQDYFDNERQLALYAYGVKCKFSDAKKIRLIWHYLAFNKEMVSTRTDNDLEDLRKETLKLINEIENKDEFPSRESSLCSWCEYKTLCPRFRHLFKIKTEEPEEFKNGKELVNEYARLDKELKEKQEELERVKLGLVEYAKRNNVENIQGSEKRAFVKCYNSMQFPKKNEAIRYEFIDILKETGLWNRLVTVDTYELAKLINNNLIEPIQIDKLSKYIKRTEIARVYLKNV